MKVSKREENYPALAIKKYGKLNDGSNNQRREFDMHRKTTKKLTLGC
jgi:hypothetical protein